MDRSSTQKKGGVSIIITTPEGDILKYSVQLQFPMTNNESKYEAILIGLRVAKALRAKTALLRSDSHLFIGQINGELEVLLQHQRISNLPATHPHWLDELNSILS